jgi:hypothetical protein
MSGTLRDLTAGFNGSEGSWTPPNLLAGDMEVITTHLPLAASTAVQQFQVLAFVGGVLVPYDDTDDAGAEEAYAIAVQAAASGTQRDIPVFIGGFFNHEALVWPAGADTLAERREAFRAKNQNILIGPIPAVRANG